MIIGVAITICGLLLFVANQFLIPFLKKHSIKARKSTMEVALSRFFVFIELNYPALFTFMAFYFLIDFINIFNVFTKILFWGFGGWLFISCYKTAISYILAPQRIRNIFAFHDNSIAYIRKTISNISISVIIYFIFVNILSILKIPLEGRFACSLLFIAALFIVTIIFSHYGFKKAIYHPYTIRYFGKIISGETRDSRLFQIAADLIYFSLSLFFCSELVLILTGYVHYALKAIIWFGIVNACFISLLLIKTFVSHRRLRRKDSNAIVSSRTITTQGITVTAFFNPEKIVFNLWQYRYFVLSSIRNELINRFARSKLGGLWVIVNPLAQVAIYAFILSSVLAAKLPGIDNKYAYAIYLMSGLLAWNLFNEIISRCLNLFIVQGNLMKKMSFPRITLPSIVIGSCLLNNILLLVAMLGILALLGHQFSVAMLWLIPLTIPVVMLAMGIGLVLGVMNVFLRDIEQVILIILQVWFWFTPIVYPESIIPESYRNLLNLNPMYPIAKAYHQVLVYNNAPQLGSIAIISAIAFTLMLLSLFMFRRASAEMVDAL